MHISDSSLGLSRSAYDAGRKEKDARAALSSAIKRDLTPGTIVVADALNYIKGFRYQLHCEAKAVRSTYAVVQCGVPEDICREWNEKALSEGTGGYERDIFEALVVRYEEPDKRNRWDAPLFVVAHDDTQPPCEAIWDVLVGEGAKGKVVRPNAATVMKRNAPADYLAYIEKVCGDVVRRLDEWGRENPGVGGEVKVVIPDQKEELVVELPVEGVAAPKLQRLRRQFIAQNRVAEVERSRIGPLFVDYLNDAFRD